MAMSFGKRLAEARRCARLTQEQLAKSMGCHPSLISQFETGAREPSLRNFIKLAARLPASSDWLLFGSGWPPNEISLAECLGVTKVPGRGM